jgi:purine-binding chemotaxis protein CheW
MPVKQLLQIVSFELNGQPFGAPLSGIQEIIRHPGVVKVPRTPDFIEGIINLRGHVIPVIDIKRRFGMPSGESTQSSRIIVAELAGAKAGLEVDSVSRVLSVSDAVFEKAPAIVSGISERFISGVVKSRDGMLIVLELDHILSAEEVELLRNVE